MSDKYTFSLERHQLAAFLRQLADQLDLPPAPGAQPNAPDTAGQIPAHAPQPQPPTNNQRPATAQAAPTLPAVPLPPDFSKCKLALRNEHGHISVECKVKGGKSPQEAAKPPYPALKKRLAAAFKIVRKAAAQGTLPPPDKAAAFIADSRTMLDYPGYGDEHYATYGEAVDAFAAAMAAQDAPAVTRSVVTLQRLMADCHERYR